jgi:bud site selection protein 31
MYVKKIMNKELYDWLVREKIADGALIAKWRKPGYEILCSMLAIQRSNHNFGTTSHCRVPLRQRAPAQRVTPDVQTGCICCASGDGKFGGPVWWNTPLDDDTNDQEGAQGNRAVWGQATDEAQQEDGHDDDGGQPGPSSSQGGGGTKKRPVQEVYSDEDELEEDVKKRLEAMRGAG